MVVARRADPLGAAAVCLFFLLQISMLNNDRWS